MITPILFNYSEQPAVHMMADAEAPPVQSLSDMLHQEPSDHLTSHQSSTTHQQQNTMMANADLSSQSRVNQRSNLPSSTASPPMGDTNSIFYHHQQQSFTPPHQQPSHSLDNYSNSLTNNFVLNTTLNQHPPALYPSSSSYPQTLVIFGFLPEKLDEILQHFKSLGVITSLQTPPNQNYCYITFESSISAQSALRWNASMLCGCMIGVVTVESLNFDMNRSPLSNSNQPNNGLGTTSSSPLQQRQDQFPRTMSRQSLYTTEQQQSHSSSGYHPYSPNFNETSALNSPTLSTTGYRQLSDQIPTSPVAQTPRSAFPRSLVSQNGVSGSNGPSSRLQFRKLTAQTPEKIMTPTRLASQQQQAQVRNMETGIVQKNSLWNSLSDTLFGW